MVWSYLQVKRQKREVQMARLNIATSMKTEVSPLSLIISSMFVIEVLVLLKA